MDCSEVKAQLVEAAFGLADDPAVKAHAETCASCGPALAGLAERRRALRSWGARTPSPELHDRILRKVRAGGRRRLLLAVAAGLLMGIPVALAGGRPAAPDRIDGDFEVRQGESWQPAPGGRPAVAGLEIRTREGRARMTLGGRSEIDVHPGTQMAVRSIDPSGPIVLSQERGEAHFRVRPGSGPFEVRTPAASVHVQGTEFRILMKGEASMKKGTVLGTALAAVVGVSSGMVAVRNTHGEIRVPAGSTATATAAAAPKLLAESESRIRGLETERTTIAQRMKADLEQLQELSLREKELESTAPPPKKSGKGDALKAMMSVGLRGNAKQMARKLQKSLTLTEQQTGQVEEMMVEFMNQYMTDLMVDRMTIEDLERMARGPEGLEKRISGILNEDQKKELAKNPIPMSGFGMSSSVTGYEGLLKDLDPAAQKAAVQESNSFMTAFSVVMIRAQVTDSGKESIELLEQLVPRYTDRMKKIVPEPLADTFGTIMRQLAAGARKDLEKQNDKK